MGYLLGLKFRYFSGPPARTRPGPPRPPSGPARAPPGPRPGPPGPRPGRNCFGAKNCKKCTFFDKKPNNGKGGRPEWGIY